MNRGKFLFLMIALLSFFGVLKNVKAASGRGIAYSKVFASSGWNTPAYIVIDELITNGLEPHFGPCMTLNNTSGVGIGSTGNTGNTIHDVRVDCYFYLDGSSNTFGCFLLTNNPNIILYSNFQLEEDNYDYKKEFYLPLVYHDGYKMTFKKAWNDTWGGTLTGVDYIFEWE